MDDISIVIIGSLHHNTLGVVRSIGEAGVPQNNITVLLVGKNCSSKNLISTSKYVDPERVSFVHDYDDIVPWLMENSDFDGQKVIICCSDGASGAVISENDLLKGKYKVPDTLMDITELMVKSNQGKIAEATGLTVPLSADFVTNGSIDWNVFPCIVKPYKSATAAGKSDIHVIYSKQELDNILKVLQSDKIQIQQYIDKDIEFQLIGCSLDAGETIIIPGFSNIIRQPKTTNTGYLLFSPINELDFDMEAVKRFIKTIGYSGLFSVEFIRAKDGKDYFLEINMRNDGNAYCVESAGVNLPYIWAYYQAKGKMPDVPTSFKEPVYFIPDLNDLKLAIREIGILKWVKQFREAESHSIYNKKDMGPFKYEIIRQVKKVLRIH